LSGLMTLQPPVIKRVLPMLVPKVDADGNETSGIPSPLHQTPLGAYLGWNVTRAGFYKGRGCGFAGGFIPFAKTKTERLATGDPRLSLGERYHDHAGYVASVKKAAGRLLSQRFLLPQDAGPLVRQAEECVVLLKGPDMRRETLAMGCAGDFGGHRTAAAAPIVETLIAGGGGGALIFEMLAERTLALAHLDRRKNPDGGYASQLEAMAR